jgi:hypothetical protein
MTIRKRVIVLPGQNIFGIAIQEYGTVEAVFLLLEDNNYLTDGLNSILVPGQELLIKQAPVNAEIVNYYNNNKLKPKTEITNPEELEETTGDFDESDFEYEDFLTI